MCAREFGNGRGCQQNAERQVLAKLRTDEGAQVRRQQRVSAQGEEVVVDAQGVQTKEALPEPRHTVFSECEGPGRTSRGLWHNRSVRLPLEASGPSAASARRRAGARNPAIQRDS